MGSINTAFALSMRDLSKTLLGEIERIVDGQ